MRTDPATLREKMHEPPGPAVSQYAAFVRCNSHRARQRFEARFGKAPCFYSLWRETGRGCYGIQADQIDAARAIKGVTILRGPYGDLGQCW